MFGNDLKVKHIFWWGNIVRIIDGDRSIVLKINYY